MLKTWRCFPLFESTVKCVLLYFSRRCSAFSIYPSSGTSTHVFSFYGNLEGDFYL